MEVILNKTRNSILFFVLSLFFFSVNHASFALPASRLELKIVEDNAQNLLFDYPLLAKRTTLCPTLAHLSHPDLKDKILSGYSFKNRIEEIGRSNLEKIINEIINKEISLEKDYFVLYHGTDRRLMFTQDLYEGIYKIFYKKAFLDFVMLRIPSALSKKYDRVEDFLGAYRYRIDNAEAKQRNLLLSVNPSLFANSYQNIGSSTFHYFLNSDTCFGISILDLVQEILNYFKISELYKKYQKEYAEIDSLLSESEKEKTGILLQIFIPKNLVDNVLYHAIPGGNPYYASHNYCAPKACQELEQYQKTSFISCTQADILDQMQFRLLLNKELLNPDSGIKFFKYYNETENTKKYKKLLNELLNKIAIDIQEQSKNKKHPWYKRLYSYLTVR